MKFKRLETRQGSMTVFMTLILSLLVSLVCTCLWSAQNAAARIQLLEGMDLGLFSMCAGYDRELLDRYEVFFLDGSYGDTKIDQGKLCDTFASYMDPVLDQNYQSFSEKTHGIASYVLATDGEGYLFYKQVIEYMKKSLGVTGLQLLLEKTKKESEQSKEALEDWENAEENKSLTQYDTELDRAEKESKELLEKEQKDEEDIFVDESIKAEEKPEIKVFNPIPTLMKIRQKGILGLILPYDRELSGKGINLWERLAYRENETGLGAENVAFSSGVSEHVLFHEYILKKFGCYSEPANHTLDYEAEYILLGKETDVENLKGVAAWLLAIREGVNLAYLMSDASKQAEAESLSLAIASCFAVPPAAVIIKTVLLLCWSFAESIVDLRTIFAGKKVPLWKSAATWRMGLSEIASVLEIWDAPECQDGIDYKDYLRILLFLKNEAELCVRCMDVTELNIRYSGRKNFRMDSCIGEIEMWTKTEVNGRKEYSVTRKYSYIQGF